jgi:vitamin B12/bleomycin/antimicrobial peptide transport system ATP-binding/permease protein
MILLSTNNTFMTYITKWAMNALEHKKPNELYQMLALATFMFLFAVPINAFKVYNLGYFWRKWYNQYFLNCYLKNRSYYNLSLYGNVDNPDQRIAQDLFDFINQSMNFLGIFGMSIISIFSFMGVLLMINYWLVVAVFTYAAVANRLDGFFHSLNIKPPQLPIITSKHGSNFSVSMKNQ